MRKYEDLDADIFENILNQRVFFDKNKTVADVINGRKPVLKDIKKIFGDEKIIEADWKTGLGIVGITGIVKVHNFAFLGIEARTEGQYPVYMILYVAEYRKDLYDKEKISSANIRAYIPEKGNTFNEKTRSPYSLKDAPEGLQCDQDLLIMDIAKHFYEWWQNYVPIFEKIG